MATSPWAGLGRGDKSRAGVPLSARVGSHTVASFSTDKVDSVRQATAANGLTGFDTASVRWPSTAPGLSTVAPVAAAVVERCCVAGLVKGLVGVEIACAATTRGSPEAAAVFAQACDDVGLVGGRTKAVCVWETGERPHGSREAVVLGLYAVARAWLGCSSSMDAASDDANGSEPMAVAPKAGEEEEPLLVVGKSRPDTGGTEGSGEAVLGISVGEVMGLVAAAAATCDQSRGSGGPPPLLLRVGARAG